MLVVKSTEGGDESELTFITIIHVLQPSGGLLHTHTPQPPPGDPSPRGSKSADPLSTF